MNGEGLSLARSRLGRRYGWRRSAFSHLLFPEANTTGLGIKEEVDPRPKMPPALDQGNLGSCTANATARCFRYDTIQDGKDCKELSRRWIYHFEKAIEGTLGEGDTGAYGHDAFRVARHGIPAEGLYPYSENIADVERKPPDVEPRAYTLKKQVHTVPRSWNAFQQVFSNGQTVAFGFTVYESFEDESWWGSGLMPTPSSSEGVLGGHETLACGFLKAHPGYVLVLNSWGRGFGLDGYFLMPVSYFLSSYADDYRTIVRS